MLKNMSISAEEKKDSSILSVVDDKPNYPYGLKITLDPETFKKLGIDVPEIGQKAKVMAIAEVVSVNKEGEKGSVGSYSVTLQIQELDVDCGDKKDKSVSSMLYGANS